MLTLLIALLFAVPAFADTTDVPEALRQAIVRYTEPYTTAPASTEWQVRWADLNGDTHDDALVLISGPDWCGSGGCTLVVFEAVVGEDAEVLGPFRPAAEVSQVHGEVRVAATRTLGWHDLVAHGSDGTLRRLRFDGESYPRSPDAGEPLPAEARDALVLAEAP